MKGPMPATLKFVAKLAGVAPVTVSRVVNGSENVAPRTREKILAIIRDLDYTPNMHAANLRRGSRRGSRDRSIAVKGRPRAGSDSHFSVTCPADGAFLFSPEEREALAGQMMRLRRDLERLRKHA